MKRSTPWSLALIGLALGSSAFAADTIDPTLAEALDAAAPDATVSALFYLEHQTDVKSLAVALDAQRARRVHRHATIVRALQDQANATQGPFLAELNQLSNAGDVRDFDAFWIANVINVKATPAVIEALADRPEVGRVYLDLEIELVAEVSREADAAQGAAAGAIEPGVIAVRAPEAWALGYDGTGVLVANMDTGVDGNHPSLASRWAGLGVNYAGHPEWAWFDPQFDDNSFPYDDGGHGSHTMGTVCGGMPGDQIGVAPGATWIAAGAIDRPGAGIPGTVANAIEAFEWLADPDGNPATAWDVPHVCSNSWGLVDAHGYADCDPLFWSYIDNLEAAGCIVVFSAGNESTNGLRRPADRATDEFRTLAVAAVDGNDPAWPLAGFSSEGPTQCTPSGADAIKPDISAPGVSVRSSVPGGGYSNFSGTSMASPHINGVIAIMLQANPDLSSEQVKQILYDTAVDLGSGGEDNQYGYGMVDAYEAVQAALATVGLTFDFPNGRPQYIDPNGATTIRVQVSGQSATPQPDTGTLYYRADGGAYTAVAMNQVTPNVYDAIFPSFPCGSLVEYYFSAEASTGEVAFNPFSAPDQVYSGEAYTGLQIAFEDDGETDTGWSVENITLDDGGWDRGVPVGGGDRGDPADDADGSGACWLTDNEDGNSDVDGGPTILTSPAFDATGLDDAEIEYRRWFTVDDGDTSDTLDIEISNNDGASWTLLESVTGGGGWQTVSHRFADIGVTPTSTMRLRFSASDNPNDSVTEAGIDGIVLKSFFCEVVGTPCPGDVDGSGEIEFGDLLILLSSWGPCVGCPADIDEDGVVDFEDLLAVLAAWGPCP